MTKIKPRKYRCPLCKKIMLRESNKQIVESFCEKIGKTARMVKVI